MKKTCIRILMSAVLILTFSVVPGFAQDAGKAGGVTSMEDRIKKLEEAVGRVPESDKWFDRLQFSGVVEVEAGHLNTDFDNAATDDTSESDVDLATVELGLDANIAKHVSGHVLFKYETDTDVFVDEGFITLVGSESFPAYLIAGRQYIPFGNFDSHFLSDPMTLDLGETIEGAVVAGYRFGGGMFDLSLGVFNGNGSAPKFNEDSTISNYMASFSGEPIEGLVFGAAYTSNIAAAGGLADNLTMDRDLDGNADLNDYVGGWSAFVSYTFMNFKVIGEYVTAADEFEVGEVFDANGIDTKKKQPSAWNAEIGYAITDAWEVAGRYEASTDTDADIGTGDGFAENRYGAVVNWGVFDATNLALEYMRANYLDDFKTEDALTLQLAVEF